MRLRQGGHPLVPQPGDLHQVWSASSEPLSGTAGLVGGCLVSMGCPGWTAELNVHWLWDRNNGRAGWKRPQEVSSPTSTTANTRDEPDAQSCAGAQRAAGSAVVSHLLDGTGGSTRALQLLLWTPPLRSPQAAEQPGPLLVSR